MYSQVERYVSTYHYLIKAPEMANVADGEEGKIWPISYTSDY